MALFYSGLVYFSERSWDAPLDKLGEECLGDSGEDQGLIGGNRCDSGDDKYADQWRIYRYRYGARKENLTGDF